MKHVYSSYTRNTTKSIEILLFCLKASLPCFPPIIQYNKYKKYHSIIDNDFHCQLLCKNLFTNRGSIVPVKVERDDGLYNSSWGTPNILI